MKMFANYIIEAKTKTNPYRYTGANPTVDLVVFREGESGLEVLLIKRARGSVEGGKWAIPGGFVNTTAKAGGNWKDGETESIVQAALRELEEETGLRITPELRQGLRSVGIYKGGGRDPRDNKTSWSMSYAFVVTIPQDMGDRVRGMDDASDARWYPVDRLPPRLAFDHKDILTDAIGKSKDAEQRKATSEKVRKSFKREREGMSKVFGGLQMDTSPAYVDIGHPESPYEKPDQKAIEALRQKVWGVKQGSRLPDLWVYHPALKPSKNLRYVNIRPLPREEMFRATHDDIFPELRGISLSDTSFGRYLQGRIDHDRKIITAVSGNRYDIIRLSNSTIDRVFAELKKLYPGYKIYDQIDESVVLSFLEFITEALGTSKEAKQRKASTEKVRKSFKQEREGMSGVFGGLEMFTTPTYADFAHPESPYKKPDQKAIEALRQKVWGVKQGSRLPDLWVYSPALKPSKGLRYVNIRPLPRKEMFSATHEDIFPELLDISEDDALDFLQGRIDHDRKVITAVHANPHRSVVGFSSSTIDRIFAELKRAYPGYKIFDQIGESRLMPFSAFITEANRGLTTQKDKWETITTGEVRRNRNVQQDIFDIINAAYGPIGGHPDFPNADAVPADNNITDVIDTDEPDDVDAVVLSKTTTFGKKLTTLGSDGGAEAKREVLKKAVEILNTQGSYVEASGKLLDILVARGAPVVKDEAAVRAVLKGKEIEWLGDGVYSRKIGGKAHRKTMLGKPRI